MRILVAIAALTLCHGALAQPFKCTDAAGKITYTGQACAELGLKDSGAVQDRVQVQPALPASARPPARAAQDEPAKLPAQAPVTQETPPERRCFTVTLKGGRTATRCNDKPDED